MPPSRGHLIIASSIGLVLLAAGCGGGSGAPQGDVQITLRDFDIQLSKSTLQSGQRVFAATNEGPSVHEFEIFSVPEGVDADALPVGDNVADTDGRGLEVIDEVEDIAPSTSSTLTVSLEAGTYAVICNLPGHYEQGMHATITVS